jgi:hypothetical protein
MDQSTSVQYCSQSFSREEADKRNAGMCDGNTADSVCHKPVPITSSHPRRAASRSMSRTFKGACVPCNTEKRNQGDRGLFSAKPLEAPDRRKLISRRQSRASFIHLRNVFASRCGQPKGAWGTAFLADTRRLLLDKLIALGAQSWAHLG